MLISRCCAYFGPAGDGGVLGSRNRGSHCLFQRQVVVVDGSAETCSVAEKRVGIAHEKQSISHHMLARTHTHTHLTCRMLQGHILVVTGIAAFEL